MLPSRNPKDTRIVYQISMPSPRQSCRRGSFHGGNAMTAQITRQAKDSITIEVTMPLTQRDNRRALRGHQFRRREQHSPATVALNFLTSSSYGGLLSTETKPA